MKMSLRPVAWIAALGLVLPVLWMIGYIPSVPFVLLLIGKAAQSDRTPKPGGGTSGRLQRVSVLECGRFAPLSRPFALLIVLNGFLLYPTALGFTSVDVYSLGWSNIAFVSGVAIVAFAFLFRNDMSGTLLVAALLAAALRILPSTNLWDYLIDPIFFFYCIGYLFTKKPVRIQPCPDSTPPNASLP